MSAPLLDSAVKQLDRDGNGQISYKEFKAIFDKKSISNSNSKGKGASAEWMLSPFGPPLPSNALDSAEDRNSNNSSNSTRVVDAGINYHVLRLKKVIALFNMSTAPHAASAKTSASSSTTAERYKKDSKKDALYTPDAEERETLNFAGFKIALVRLARWCW